MKKNNKGFTLVELIVVLVILAILAAVLVPALLGYIDKAKAKKDMNAAETAYVAAQAVYSEWYGTGVNGDLKTKIVELTDLKSADFSITVTPSPTTSSKSKSDFIITKFVYKTTDGGEYTWENGTWKTK